ncbi:MAG: hypothetical protein J6T84_06070 [Spirochaetaceae bacterium]|nr:hypothetical protein [Spirochaetaceae bacterium]
MKSRHNIRKTPESVLSIIRKSTSNDFVVYAEQALSNTDIQNNVYSNLGITFENDKIKTKPFIPQKTAGRFCKYNQTVREIVHKDLPKQTGYHYYTVPNFGDYSKGTHEAEMPYEYYPREYIPPSFTEISLEVILEDKEETVFRFVSTEVLNKKSKDFQLRLFSNLNMFQELFGSFKIKESDKPYPEYLKTLKVNWEILPEGNRLDLIKNFIRNNSQNDTPQKQQEIIERFEFLNKCHPVAVVEGTSGFQRYIGYQFNDDLMVFENLRYGNAIYVMFDSWKELSQRSRLDLLSGKCGSDFERIEHRKNWKQNLKYCLERHGVRA